MNYGIQLKKTDKRYKKYAKQRTERGFDDSETWSLDHTIARFIAPRLRVLQKQAHGHPPNLTQEGWENILGEIAEGFEAVLAIEELIWEKYDFDIKKYRQAEKELYRKANKGLELFKKWYFNLWS